MQREKEIGEKGEYLQEIEGKRRKRGGGRRSLVKK
jgi:hypothetical protein